MRSVIRSRLITAMAAALGAAALLVAVRAGVAQTGGSGESVPDIGAAEYTADDRLVFPESADRWIALGAGIGSDYNGEAFDPAQPGPIGVVQMEPAAYDYFLQNGRYADGSMFLLTFYGVQQKPDPALQGFVQGDVVQREIHVIDRQRFPEEGRAFFLFSGDEPAAVAPLPQGSVCVQCHTEHGDFDGTFVQFYPPLR